MFCNSSGVRISFLSEDLAMPKAGPHSDLLIIFGVATTFGGLQFGLLFLGSLISLGLVILMSIFVFAYLPDVAINDMKMTFEKT